jgi:peroxiredoxin
MHPEQKQRENSSKEQIFRPLAGPQNGSFNGTIAIRPLIANREETFMSEQHQPFLHAGEIVPAFSLPGADGMPHSPWDYKQRENLVIILLTTSTTSEARGLLKEFKRQYPELREEYCAVLVVTANTVIEQLRAQEELQLPFALLADPQGTVLKRYTSWDDGTRMARPSIVLTNRYGALRAQWIAANEAELPPIETVLSDLQYLNTLCTP